MKGWYNTGGVWLILFFVHFVCSIYLPHNKSNKYKFCQNIKSFRTNAKSGEEGLKETIGVYMFGLPLYLEQTIQNTATNLL